MIKSTGDIFLALKNGYELWLLQMNLKKGPSSSEVIGYDPVVIKQKTDEKWTKTTGLEFISVR